MPSTFECLRRKLPKLSLIEPREFPHVPEPPTIGDFINSTRRRIDATKFLAGRIKAETKDIVEAAPRSIQQKYAAGSVHLREKFGTDHGLSDIRDACLPTSFLRYESIWRA